MSFSSCLFDSSWLIDIFRHGLITPKNSVHKISLFRFPHRFSSLAVAVMAALMDELDACMGLLIGCEQTPRNEADQKNSTRDTANRFSQERQSPQLAIFAAPSIDPARRQLLFFTGRLAGNTQPHPRNSLAAGFRNSAAAFITIDGALTSAELAPGTLYFVINTRFNLILNGTIPRPSACHSVLPSTIDCCLALSDIHHSPWLQ